jgi:Squalene-hopene cyclase C-terminal domain
MARQNHSVPSDAFAAHEDFATQLHETLKKSPWWMLSIAFHVVVALVLSMFTTVSEADVKPKPLQSASIEKPLDEEPPDTQPVDDPLPVPDIAPPEPKVFDDVPVDDKTTDDNDNPLDDSTVGETDTAGSATLDGPQNNSLMGPGGGAGGGRGPGGMSRRQPPPGGGRQNETNVLDGLRWLAAHQSPDGSWGAADFTQWCDGKPNPGERPDGAGGVAYDVGVSGLALCAFLGAGYTHRGNHEFAQVVRRGLAFLRNCQDPEGCFGPRSTQHYIYNHATAALAMVEAYAMTESNIFKGSAQKALDFIGLTRNPYFVWRYGIKPGDNDSSVTGWMMMALKSAQLVNADAVKRGRPRPLTYDEDAFEGIQAWLDKMTDPDYGRVGYVTRGSGPARPQDLVDRFPGEKSESMTAVGVLARIFMGADPRKDAMVQKGVTLMSKLPPTWNTNDGSIDMYYWYYATLALFQVGGAPWKAWDGAMSTSIVANQRKDGVYCGFKGSWDPVDPWGSDGGRVYSTALLTMCLEVYYRYDRVIGTK